MVPFSTQIQNFGRWVRANANWLLIGAAVPLFTTKTLFNAPLLIMAGIALYRIARGPKRFPQLPELRLFLVLFLAIWIPIAFSLLGAVNFERSLSTAFRYWGFVLVAVYAIAELRDPSVRDKLLVAVAVVVGVWCIDALIQFAFGRNLLGYPAKDQAVTGLFHPKVRLGVVTAVFTPVVYEVVRRYGRRYPWLWLVVASVVIAVLLNGRRSGWMMLGIAAIGYILYLHAIMGGRRWWRMVGVSAIVAVVGVGAVSQTDLFQARWEKTRPVLQLDYEGLNRASSYRFDYWKEAAYAFRDHWIVGIGPRGFRHVDEQYRVEAGVPEGRGIGTHPHSMLMEVALETGTIGLVGYLVFLLILIWRLIRVPPGLKPQIVPWGLCAVVAAFPLNVNHAFYSSFWGAITWWALAVTAAAFAAEGRNESDREQSRASPVQ